MRQVFSSPWRCVHPGFPPRAISGRPKGLADRTKACIFLALLLMFVGCTRNNTTSKDQREELAVGFLPVTCHLTCPVTDFATSKSGKYHFKSQRFTDFPSVAESIKSGSLDATFLLAPLAMKLREQDIKTKIVYLGHRDGSTLIVRKESTAKSLRDLKGKNFAIPSKYSNQHLVIRKLMEDQGLAPTDIHFVEMAPPDMPGALAANAIDAYFVGEPHAAKAEVEGVGRVLYFSKDIWPDFVSCVLVVTEKLINERPEIIHELVRGIAESGEWAEKHRVDAAKIAAPYFRQNESLIKYVLTTPDDRVSYRKLTPTDADILKIQAMALKTGIISKKLPLDDMLDRRFIPKKIVPANIQMSENK